MRNLSGIYNEILQSISHADPRLSSDTFQNSFEVPEEPPVKMNVLEALYEQRPNVPSTQDFSVLKISGSPWDTAISDVFEFFDPIKIPNSHQPPYFTECVHFVPNGGKNLDVFVEFPTKELAKEAFDLKSTNPTIFRTPVRLSYTSQIELQRRLFPQKRIQKNRSDIEDGIIYMSQEGILSLLTACRSVKHSSSSFKAKILHRPFQAVISVLAKVDWSRTKEISTLQRDHLFEMVKLSIDATNLNSWPSYTQKPKEIVAIKTRLLRAGLCVPLFTEKQKVILLNTAGLPCPKDLIVYVYTPEEGVENEFLKYSSSTPHRLRKPSTETVVGVIPYSPPDSSPSSTAYRNLRHRADQADQVISLLQNDLHSMTLKYQNTIFELDRVEEGYKNLKREFEYVKGYSKSLKGGRDTLGLQEPSPGIDTVRSTNPFDMDRLAGHPSPSPSYTSRRLQSFDGDTRANQYSLFEEVGESSEYTNHWRKWIELIL